MADLDDFFAKKDRKRNKQARKYSTPDELAKRLEEPRKPKPAPQPQQPAQPAAPQQPAAAQQPQPQQLQQSPPDAGDDKQQQQQQQQPQVVDPPQVEEDEWREVEVAKKADYTGLKIQHLTPGQETPQGNDGNTTSGYSTNNDQNKKGPWNKTATMNEAPEPVKEERELPAPSEVVLPPPPSSSSKAYISPAMRNRPAGGFLDPPVRNRFGKPMAPDINNQEFFPSLGEGRKAHHGGGGERGGGGGGGGGSGSWSEANRGAPPSARPPPREVSLGNRFNSLTNDS